MTSMLTHVLDRPDAWVNAGKDRFERPLSSEEIDVLERLVIASRHLPVLEITRDDFDHPTVRALAADIRKQLREGPGTIVLSGLLQDRFSPDDYERIYWGIGRHLGEPAIQNYLGDLLTRVEKQEEGAKRDVRTKGRGYTNSDAAGYHTDTNEIVGLMCIERAENGGNSVITSAVAIHNDFVRNHPELLPALYEGYYSAIGQDEVMTDEKGPIFAYVDGHLSVYAQFRTMRLAEKRGEELSPELKAAIDYFNERAVANEAEFLLEAGDILMWNNRTQLHGRRSFENSPARKRLLLRLWLQPKDAIPLPANFIEFTKQRIRQADAQRHRENALTAS